MTTKSRVERPAIFMSLSAWLIRQGLKDVTRRVMKPQPVGLPDGAYCDPYNGNFEHFTFWTSDNRMILGAGGNIKNAAHWRCPYGVPGGYLWAREPYLWNKAAPFPKNAGGPEDLRNVVIPSMLTEEYYRGYVESGQYERHSPMFMPRWACTLDGMPIVHTSVLRVQEMDRAEAEREGVVETTGEMPPHLFPEDVEPHEWDNRSSVENYRFIWNFMHGHWCAVYKRVGGMRQVVGFECYPWAEEDVPPIPRVAERNGLPCTAYPNPWVWRVEFGRQEITA